MKILTKEEIDFVTRNSFDWYYPYITDQEVMMMSGWKIYVYGKTADDGYEAYRRTAPIAHQFNLTMKIASQHIINRNKNSDVSWSPCIIYLDREVFKYDMVGDLVRRLRHVLIDYPHYGEITGAKSISGEQTDKLFYRYDMQNSCDPTVGMPYTMYLSRYRGEYGGYNIPGNEDITSFLK